MSTSLISIFEVDGVIFQQVIHLDNDSVEILRENNESTGLLFNYKGDIIYQNKTIGKVRLPYSNEEIKTMKFIWDKSGEIIDTGICEKDIECFLKAEVFITKYIIENNLILAIVKTETLN